MLCYNFNFSSEIFNYKGIILKLFLKSNEATPLAVRNGGLVFTASELITVLQHNEILFA